MIKPKSILTGLALAVSLALPLTPCRAQLPPPAGSVINPSAYLGFPNATTVDTNYTAFALTNNQTLSYTPGSTNTYQKTIRQGTGLTLMLAVWQTNTVASTTTNYTVKFDVTGDGGTWTKGGGQYPITWTVPLAGAGISTNVFWTNIPPNVLSNFRKMQATQASTTASNNVFAALLYSQSSQ